MAASMKKRKLSDLSVDDFMAHGFDEDSEEDVVTKQEETKKGKKKHKQKKTESPQVVRKVDITTAKETAPDMKKKGKEAKHKMQMSRLQEVDPEFYQFLQKEDKNLLEFEDSDSDDSAEIDEEEEEDEDDEDDSEEDILSGDESESEDADGNEEEIDLEESDSDEEELHKPEGRLEVMSDEDEDDDEEEAEDQQRRQKGKLVTMAMVQKWRKALRDQPSLPILHEVIRAFRAAVLQTSSEEGEEDTKYRVEGSQVFNAVVGVCIKDVAPALLHLFGVKSWSKGKKTVMPSSHKKWNKMKLDIKTYLSDVIKLSQVLSEASVVSTLLRHVLQLVHYYICFPKLCRVLLKRLISLWSEGEESVQVIAFFCVYRITKLTQAKFLEWILKQMYLAYVKNTKFTSPNSLPGINFMQRSLTELFALDLHTTYQHGFIYIRQLAIHLRNAIMMKKKENYQSVYNWQYVHCLYLWCRVLSTLYPSDILQPLIYPLVQVIIGTIKLVPTARFYPLRFHCVRALTLLSDSTNTFVPVLPFILQVFEQTDFNKKHSKTSVKPLNFAVMLKLSNAQLQEQAFRDGVIDQLYELLMSYFNTQSHTVGFPELVLTSILQMKDFMKKCKVANYTRQIKQILDKVQETCKFITDRRSTVNFSLTDKQAIENWERQTKQQGTPLSKFHDNWRKLRDRELMHEIAGKDRISDTDLPTIKRRAVATDEDRDEFKGLFESDSESDQEHVTMLEKKPADRQDDDDASDDIDDSEDIDGEDDSEDEMVESPVVQGKGSPAAKGIEEKKGKKDDRKAVSDAVKRRSQKYQQESSSDGEGEDIVEDFEFSSDED
ncbi:nucleolar complex protein 2 homolog [Branchiostoma floridae]|uniref:Nucleolar complex protein 2 homolog n=1 Tax=Branchiostoma floridae TaxID=7739 RepID=A0A9J7MC81_BRAFL|nr:nucleolar complex protein 2 homolog [Branchiostoma floridae]